jgi:hypothetical protein
VLEAWYDFAFVIVHELLPPMAQHGPPCSRRARGGQEGAESEFMAKMVGAIQATGSR